MKRLVALSVFAAALTGCSTMPQQDSAESFNRAVYGFNDAVDRAVLRPVAETYESVLPGGLRHCVHNVFANLGDIWSSFNSFLQGDAHQGINSAGRVLLNSTMGVFGCFDLATGQGVERQPEDFGQTLAVWGVGSGPYVVLPLLGPSTLRDALALPLDIFGNPIEHISHVPTRNSTFGLWLVDGRATLLPATRLVDQVAIDPYSFTRDAYIQRRNSLIHNGNPPLPPLEE